MSFFHALKTVKIDIISRSSLKPWQLGQNYARMIQGVSD